MTYEQSHSEKSASGSGMAEIGSMVAVGLIAMALLAFGYLGRGGTQTAQAPASPSQTAPVSSNPAAQVSAPAQPRATGANTPAAPTTSTSGVGASSGAN